MEKYLNKKNIAFVILLIIAIVTHWKWVNLHADFYSWDFPLWPDSTLKNFFLTGKGVYNSFFNYGASDVLVTFNSFFIVWGFFEKFSLASKFTLLFPIIFISVISPFVLIKKITKNNSISFITSLFFSLSISLLYLQLSHVPIAIAFALTPLIILTFLNLLDDFSYKKSIIFSICFSVGIWYEIRMMYVASLALFLYWIFYYKKEDIFNNFKKYFLLACVIALLNSFWILPILSGDSSRLGEMMDRGITDNDSNNIIYAFSNFKHKWTGGLVTQSSTMQNIPWYVWIAPIFAFSALLLLRKVKDLRDRKMIIFFAVVALLGILLSKQTDPPFVNLYKWLYENVPGFSIFRVASKFLVLVALGYLGLFAFALKYLVFENEKVGKYSKVAVLIFFSVIFLWNAKPLVTGEIGNLFVEKIQPEEYKVLNEFISSKDGYFRTIWFPKLSKWGYFNVDKPAIQMFEVGGYFSDFYDCGKDGCNEKEKMWPFLRSGGERLADISSIRYFIVPMYDSQDELLYASEGEYTKMTEEIKKIRFLEEVKLDSLEKIKIYENKEFLPHIFVEDSSGRRLGSEFEIIGQTKKEVVARSIGDDFVLVMNNAFDRNWKVSGKNQKEFFSSWSLFGATHFSGEHFAYVNFLNGWRFNIEDICKNADFCEKNSDGTYNIELVVEYWPQRWYYFGLLISGLSLLGCALFLLYTNLIRKK